jgi:hypothetical protein
MQEKARSFRSLRPMPHEPFFCDVQRKAFWLACAPWLHVSDVGHGLSMRGSQWTTAPTEPWPPDGYLRLDPLLDPAAAAALGRAVAALQARGIHPTFLYVYDEAWQVLDALLPKLAPLLGADAEALADVWAWCIDPRTHAGGWPLHRGWYEDVRDPAGVPGLVNVWVSLTAASERNACMHVVPLPRDRHYPGALRDLSGLDALGVPLPTAAGTALAWDANVAHWGGTCDPTFAEPRISMSFTLGRPGHPAALAPLPRPLGFAERLEVIADQIQTYGRKELAADRVELRWAEMIRGMRRMAGVTSKR